MWRRTFESLRLRNLCERFHDLHNLLPFGILVLFFRVLRNLSFEGRFLGGRGSPCNDICHAIDTGVWIQDKWRASSELTVH